MDKLLTWLNNVVFFRQREDVEGEITALIIVRNIINDYNATLENVRYGYHLLQAINDRLDELKEQ